MLPMSIAYMTPPMTVADANVLSRKMRRLTTGAFAVSSRMTNDESDTAATNDSAVMTGESNQSSRCPSSRTYCSVDTPTHIKTIPATSRFFFCTSARARLATSTSSGSWTKRSVMITPMTPIGRLM